MIVIDNAIASCPANEVVQLESGTYTITGGLTFGTVSDVTLRGAGPDQTKLVFTGPGTHECGGNADVCFFGNPGWTANYAGSHLWTAGYSQGSTVLTLDSTSGLSAGQIIILDQRDDSVGIVASPNGATESSSIVTITTTIPHGYSVGQCVGIGEQLNSSDGNSSNPLAGYQGWFTITAIPSPTTFQYNDTSAGMCLGSGSGATGLAASGGGYATVDTGGVFISNIQGPVTDEGESGPIGRSCPDSSDPACASGEYSWRSQTEVKRITAVCTGAGQPVSACTGANEIVIMPGIHLNNWRSTRAPAIWWTGTTYDVLDGIEDLTLDATKDGGFDDSATIEFFRTYECWVKNIRSINADRNHVWIREGSARDEVVDSYFFGGKSGASSDYGVEIYEASSDNLIQNNICQHLVSCIMTGGSTGSVYAYNFAFDSGAALTPWLYPLMSENHDNDLMNLFEGNDVPGAVIDNVHGTGAVETTFRNRLRGQDTPAKTESLLAAANAAFNRGNNFVGNVMGTAGSETGYDSTALLASGYIWNLNDQSENYNVPNDPLVADTLLRWGNYDVVSAAVRWCGNSADPGWTTICASTSEIPTSSFAFINGNAVPATTTLPASFYLSGQPAFWQTAWGTPPWPAIGPDVTGGTAPDSVAAHSYSIPAQSCFANTSIDSSYQKSFAVSGASFLSNQVTLTLAANVIAPGSAVTVSGISPAAYNGTYGIQSSDAPYALSVSVGIGSTSGGSLPTGTYQAVITYVNATGETTASTPQQQALSGSNLTLQVTPPSTDAGNATGWNVYVTTTGGSTFYKQNSTPLSLNATWTDGTSISTSGAQPPITNTAKGITITYYATEWAGSTVYGTGTAIFDSNGNSETATTGGTSGTTQPTWPTTAGGTVTDGTVMWTMASGTYISGGTIAYPNILSFNASNCYPQADPPSGTPTISSFSPSPSTITLGSSTTLSWSVSNASSVLIAGNALSLSTSTLSGSVAVTPTSTGTLVYTLSANNANGTSTAQATVTIDAAPPTVPSSLVATPLSSSLISLSWASSTDDTSVSFYLVYRGASTSTLSFVASSTALSYTDANLSPQTTYFYAVGAEDPAGNVSAQSAPVAATTAQQSGGGGGGGGITTTTGGGGGGGPLLSETPTSTLANGGSTVATSTASLEAEIASLLEELHTLQAELAAEEGSPSCSFTRDLSLWAEGADVACLQAYLNDHGFTVSPSGPGSLGHETRLFGMRTYEALIRFQESHGIRATGYFGRITRRYVAGGE